VRTQKGVRRVLKTAKFIVDSFRYRELLQIKLNTEEHLHALLQMHNMTEIWRKITTNITFGARRFGI